MSDENPLAPAELRTVFTPETSRLHAAAVWLLLLAVVAGYMVLNRLRPPERKDKDSGSPQLLVLARYAVGVQGWLGMGNPAGGPDVKSMLLSQLRDAARTPRDRLRLAPVTATGSERRHGCRGECFSSRR